MSLATKSFLNIRSEASFQYFFSREIKCFLHILLYFVIILDCDMTYLLNFGQIELTSQQV